MKLYAADLNDIRAAAQRLEGLAHRTPVFTCATLDRRAGRHLFFKCEPFQKSGSFKFRGATNALRQLSPEVAACGVVTHSSGNHAQALALAAQMAGVPAHVVMPSNASAVKRAAVAEYGGRVILCAPNLPARESTAAAVLAETGGTLIPPYDHPHIIAGQGTVALELLDQVAQLDAILAPVGGGGLLSGITLAVRELAPAMRVFGAEPAGADDAARSKAAGQFLPQTGPKTVADGLLTSMGEHTTWPVIRDLVADIFTVSDDEIIAAMRLAWQRAKLLIEPSSAVPLAAVFSARFRSLPGLARVGVVLSGGNVDLDNLPW
jgi:threonine dehydratase/serine racemase